MEINTIHNIDAIELMKNLEDDSIDHCITSPPYNINLRIHNGRYVKRSKNEKTKYDGSFEDSMPMNEYFEWQKNIITDLMRVTKGLVFYNIQMITGNKVALLKLMGHFAENIKEIIIWDKCHSEPAINRGVLNSEFEFIIVFDKNNSISRQFDIANFKRGEMSNILRIRKNMDNVNADVHSAAFPLKLVYRLLENFTNEGDLIFDPFMGTGTTAICCIELNRNYIGAEINSTYFKIIERKLKEKKSILKLF